MKHHLRIVILITVFSLSLQGRLKADGVIYLVDEDFRDYSADVVAFTPFEIGVIYSTQNGRGPDVIQGFEFMLDPYPDNELSIIEENISPEFILTFGSLLTGISMVSASCLIADEFGFISIGTFTIITFKSYMGPGDGECYIDVVPDPNALEQGIWVATCDKDKTLHEIYGWSFCMPEGASHCYPAVKTSSWGAIKSIYK